MGCCGGRKRHNKETPPQAEVGALGLVWVETVTQTAQPTYGSVTGSRYVFNRRPILLVDTRDVEGLGEGFIIHDATD